MRRRGRLLPLGRRCGKPEGVTAHWRGNLGSGAASGSFFDFADEGFGEDKEKPQMKDEKKSRFARRDDREGKKNGVVLVRGGRTIPEKRRRSGWPKGVLFVPCHKLSEPS